MDENSTEPAVTDQPEWFRVQDRAENFAIIAGLLAVVTVISGVAGWFTGDTVLYLIGAGALAVAVWLYQSAQLLYIRALLLKSAPKPAEPAKPTL
jgi:hypothetical protein